MLITGRMQEISAHMKTHRKDHASQLGLLKLIGRRRRLLNYLKRTDLPEYAKLIKRLDIRK